MTKKSKLSGRDQRLIARREEVWPGSSCEIFDLSDTNTVGYARIPRVVPMVATLLNTLDRKSPGLLYTVLWSYDHGHGLVEVDDPESLAIEAGYSASRAKRSWKERVEQLQELGFIRTAVRGAHEHGTILLLDPHRAVLTLSRNSKYSIPESWMSHFRHRCSMNSVDLASLDAAEA